MLISADGSAVLLVDIQERLVAALDGGKEMVGNAVRLAWEHLRGRAGCPDLHFHDLRHEAVTRLFERGLNIAEVSAISGHKELKMLQRYTHLRATELVHRLD